ncbi:MAG: cofactor-independent phosphoglycerate mutase [Candidatus Bathyarchaeia archaeon]
MSKKKGQRRKMKYVLIVGDGMADHAVPELGNKTPLQAARKPNIDSIAARGRSGLIKTIPDELPAGSDVAILSVLGYDPRCFYTGRGPLEAAARGIDLRQNDVAFRCNLITEKDGVLLDYSAGHITTDESTKLIVSVKRALEKPGEVEFFLGLDYRHFMILRKRPDAALVDCTPPHDVMGAKISGVLPKANLPQQEETVDLLRKLILDSKSILENHPVNVARVKAGKKPGNMIWPWGGGANPSLPKFKEKFGVSAAVISAVDLVKGIATCAGMKIIRVPGATGLSNTNYEGKADAALKALKTSDLVFVHVEAPDEAGHIGDCGLKVKTIEDLDRRLVGRILKGLEEPYAVAVLPDHPTPLEIKTHTRQPVPFTIYATGMGSDGVQRFDEVSARYGSFGLVTKGSVMRLLLSCGSSSE